MKQLVYCLFKAALNANVTCKPLFQSLCSCACSQSIGLQHASDSSGDDGFIGASEEININKIADVRKHKNSELFKAVASKLTAK